MFERMPEKNNQAVCRGCGTTRPSQGLNNFGFHYDCQPCRGCGQVKSGHGLNEHQYHPCCEPCRGCGTARKGFGLINGYHYDCGGIHFIFGFSQKSTYDENSHTLTVHSFDNSYPDLRINLSKN